MPNYLKKGILRTFAALLLALLLFSSCSGAPRSYVPPSEADSYYIDVHFIDVGQGDSTLIMTPYENILIDAGTNASEVDLVAFLGKAGVDSIDYLIISHPHADHIGGADKIIEAFDVETLVLNGVRDDNFYTENLEALATEKDVEIDIWEAGEKLEIGFMQIEVLAPLPLSNDADNNSSLVFKVIYKDASFLFTGDAEADSEEEMLESYPVEALDCDVLKVSHHGSATSSCDEFIAAVTPVLSVISCEFSNRYGHPHKQTLDTLAKYGSIVARIDIEGSVTVRSDGDEIIIIESP